MMILTHIAGAWLGTVRGKEQIGDGIGGFEVGFMGDELTLYEKIEIYRKVLVYLVGEVGFSHPCVVAWSQELDALIIEAQHQIQQTRGY